MVKTSNFHINEYKKVFSRMFIVLIIVLIVLVNCILVNITRFTLPFSHDLFFLFQSLLLCGVSLYVFLELIYLARVNFKIHHGRNQKNDSYSFLVQKLRNPIFYYRFHHNEAITRPKIIFSKKNKFYFMSAKNVRVGQRIKVECIYRTRIVISWRLVEKENSSYE